MHAQSATGPVSLEFSGKDFVSSEVYSCSESFDSSLIVSPQMLISGRCWATCMNGKQCDACDLPTCLPYCQRHLLVGDEALKTVAHPNLALGNVLVARFSLPPRYYFVFWGKCVPSRGSGRTLGNQDYLMEFDDNHNIDPTKFPGSVLKYAACPGPDELDNLVYADDADVQTDFFQDPLAGILMVTRRPLMKHEQLLIAYEADEQKTARWFRQSQQEWCNVGCDEFPARQHRHMVTIFGESFEERRWADYAGSLGTCSEGNKAERDIPKEGMG